MVRKYLTCALPLIAAALPLPAAAQQQPACADRATIVERLQSRFGEVQTGSGLSATNGVVEVFASEATGSWTIIVTLPSGQSCLIAAGEYWQQGPGPVTPSGQPA